MVVQHNLTAMNSNRMLGVTTKTQAKSTEKLSSGYKINRAADDAAGLAISEKMRKQIRGLSQASLNAQDGISAVQTAEGALTEVHDMLQRMNELAIKAGNGTMSESDRKSVQDEMDQLVTEIDRVSETTKFNETYLLKGEGKLSSAAGKAAVGIKSGSGTASDPTVYTSTDATVVKAKGNTLSGTIANGDLAPTTEEVATVTYLDAQGNQRTEKVKFQVGADAKATAANLADAVNGNDALKKLFTASSDKDAKFSVVSKLDGNKTDNTKNKVSKIEFNKVTLGGATNGTGGTSTDATQEAFEMTLGSGANDVSLASAQFTDGSSITIDGKTYTYTSGTAGNSVNTFKTLKELDALLGDGYKVELTATAMSTHSSKAAASLSQTIGAAGDTAGWKTTAISALKGGTGEAFTGIAAAQPSADYAIKAGSVSLTLKITRTADIDTKDALKFSLQVGADTTEENKISIDIESMSARSLGIDGITVTGKDSSNADAAVNTIAAAISKVSTQRSALGAVQNRLGHTINNLDNVVENTTSAEAQIRDTDMATEMVKYSNNNILAQAGQAMLAQANQVNQGVLSLLG